MTQGHPKLSSARIAAMTVAIAVHAGLLAALLRPATFRATPVQITNSRSEVLRARLLPRPRRTVPAVPAPPIRHQAVSLRARRPSQAVASTSPALPTPTSSPQSQAPSPNAAEPAPPATPSQPATTLSDGGFQQRLRDAQHGRDAPSLPGSDTRLAPAVQLTDPRNQGIGAVIRSTQRLFGITSKHCVDVEVWSSLTPEELAARHLSPADVKAANEKYQCNRPLGLSF